jgi:hypothetical protein
MADLPWDSTRCMRLLRPLRAHLAALEREQQRNFDVKSAVKMTKATAAAAKSSRNDQSPDWFGRAAARANKFKKSKTYSARARLPTSINETENSQPAAAITGEITMPDAFMAQFTIHHTVQEHVQVTSYIATPDRDESNDSLHPKPRRKKNALKAFHGVRSDDNVGGLIKAYLAIDSATQPDTITRRTRGAVAENDRPVGAPSLRAMAVRSVATYIEREASDQLTVSAEERTNVSEEVYGDLDDLSLPRESGLPIQAQLVRAHATRIVCNALRAQIIGARAGFSMVTQLGQESLAEQELLLTAIANGIRPNYQQKGCLRDPMVPLLNGLLETSMRLSSHFWPFSAYIPKTILSQLLSNPAFPVDWLSTPAYDDQWKSLVMDISTRSKQYHNSRQFLRWVICAACGVEKMSSRQNHSLQHVPVIAHGVNTWEHKNCDACNHRGSREQRTIRNAFTNSISSLLTILTSLVIVGSEEYSAGDDGSGMQISHRIQLPQIRSFLHEIAGEVLSGSHEDWIEDKKHSVFFGSRSAAVLFCSLLVEAISSDTSSFASHNQQSLVDLILSLEDSFDSWSDGDCGILEDLPSLLENICKAASQVSSTPASIWLESVIQSLNALTNLSTRSRGFIQQLCREAAEQMGVELPDNSEHMVSPVNFQRTPAKQKSIPMLDGWDVTGYRWEPMLSEWISATPARPPRPKIIITEMGPPTKQRRTKDKEVHVKSTTPTLRNGQSGIVIIDDSSVETDFTYDSEFSSPLKIHESINVTNPSGSSTSQREQRTSSSKSMAMIDVFVPPKRPQTHIRRISDLLPSSSPVMAPAPIDVRPSKRSFSPPPTPALRRPTISRPSHKSQPSSRAIPGRNVKRTRQVTPVDDSDYESSEDEKVATKRRRTQLAEKPVIRASTARRSGRLSQSAAHEHDSDEDELSWL